MMQIFLQSILSRASSNSSSSSHQHRRRRPLCRRNRQVRKDDEGEIYQNRMTEGWFYFRKRGAAMNYMITIVGGRGEGWGEMLTSSYSAASFMLISSPFRVPSPRRGTGIFFCSWHILV